MFAAIHLVVTFNQGGYEVMCQNSLFATLENMAFSHVVASVLMVG